MKGKLRIYIAKKEGYHDEFIVHVRPSSPAIVETFAIGYDDEFASTSIDSASEVKACNGSMTFSSGSSNVY